MATRKDAGPSAAALNPKLPLAGGDASQPGAVRGCGSGTALCGPCQPPRASLEPRAATAQLRPLSQPLLLHFLRRRAAETRSFGALSSWSCY
uniref:Uncharacterized protein n=1 Tax=Anser cygnoides TaxID=8845 RepID=A0A8B9EMJ2_ANSCY